MKFEFKPSFESSLKALPDKEKEEIKETAFKTIDVLSQDEGVYKGIGLKRLQGEFWEVRKGLKTRIIFRWRKDYVEFVLAGNHDQIRRFLRNI